MHDPPHSLCRASFVEGFVLGRDGQQVQLVSVMAQAIRRTSRTRLCKKMTCRSSRDQPLLSAVADVGPVRQLGVSDDRVSSAFAQVRAEARTPGPLSVAASAVDGQARDARPLLRIAVDRRRFAGDWARFVTAT
jgi:hypothetical protein